LAPTVIWGDNAGDALAAVKMHLTISADSHPLFIILGHLFSYLPFEPAYSLNLLSAATSSLAVLMVYFVVIEITGSMISAVIGAVSLCVSHAFWLHAVIGRIYGLNAFFVMITSLVLLKWRKKPTNSHLLYLAAFLFGIGLCNHLVMALTIIGFLFLSGRKLFNYLFVLSEFNERQNRVVADGCHNGLPIQKKHDGYFTRSI
jgi:dolichyl-phosphate-mannose--protein O-mannosyl transferase